MPRKRLSRNARCPCGSGKKSQACCWEKGFEWQEDDQGNVYKSTPMSAEVKEVLEQLRRAFVARQGREPGPDDLLFPDLPHPEHLEALMVEDMRAAGRGCDPGGAGGRADRVGGLLLHRPGRDCRRRPRVRRRPVRV